MKNYNDEVFEYLRDIEGRNYEEAYRLSFSKAAYNRYRRFLERFDD